MHYCQCHSSAVPTSSPLNARGVTVNSTFILLTWEPPVRDGRNGIIVSYYIRILEVPTNRTFIYERPIHTDLLIGALHPFYEYQCSVAAETAVGRGPFGATFITRTDQDGKHFIPSLPHSDHPVNFLPLFSSKWPSTKYYRNGYEFNDCPSDMGTSSSSESEWNHCIVQHQCDNRRD